MRRIPTLFLACLFAAFVASSSASAAERMWFGVQDDPTLRWRNDRAAMFDELHQYGASIVRTTVYWSQTAPQRPANAADPFDPAYRFADLDEFVRNAATRGIAVMLTIWGTPGWANGGKGQNVAPTRLSDMTSFARALASRYNGTHPGLPFVQFYGVWNESNLQQFLKPQYDSKGKPISPFIYARLYRAAYAGLKAGSPQAKIGIGETSPRGRGQVLGQPGVQETVAPGPFAKLLSTVRPRPRFDAWSHHPYPEPGAGPSQRVRFPNVNLPQLPEFEQDLNKWFGRKSTPIWITEYGFETRPGDPHGVTPAQQAAYLRASAAMARTMPYVQMYIWFLFRDDPTSAWQSGILNQNDTEKPAASVYPPLARLFDPRNPIAYVHSGASQPLVQLPVIELAAKDGPGASVFSTAKAYLNGKLLDITQPTGTVTRTGYVTFRTPVPRVAKGAEYLVSFEMNDTNGNWLYRYLTIVGT